jgi:sphingolipid delta-4 desaturase
MVSMTALFAVAGPRPILFLIISALAAFGPHPVGARRLSEHLPIVPGQPTVSYYGILNAVSFNVGYHVEHHDFPFVPWTRVARLREVAREHYAHLRSIGSWSCLLAHYFFDPRLRVDHYVGMGPTLDEDTASAGLAMRCSR